MGDERVDLSLENSSFRNEDNPKNADKASRIDFQVQIRALLNGLLGYVQILHEEVWFELTVEQRELLKRVEMFSEKLGQLLEEVYV